MRFFSKAPAVFLALIAAWSVPVYAGSVVDQALVPSSPSAYCVVSGMYNCAQTFTAGIAGQLTQLDLFLSRDRNNQYEYAYDLLVERAACRVEWRARVCELERYGASDSSIVVNRLHSQWRGLVFRRLQRFGRVRQYRNKVCDHALELGCLPGFWRRFRLVREPSVPEPLLRRRRVPPGYCQLQLLVWRRSRGGSRIQDVRRSSPRTGDRNPARNRFARPRWLLRKTEEGMLTRSNHS